MSDMFIKNVNEFIEYIGTLGHPTHDMTFLYRGQRSRRWLQLAQCNEL